MASWVARLSDTKYHARTSRDDHTLGDRVRADRREPAHTLCASPDCKVCRFIRKANEQ